MYIQFNINNDIINKSHIKNTIYKIINGLDENICINQIIKNQCV